MKGYRPANSSHTTRSAFLGTMSLLVRVVRREGTCSVERGVQGT